jgi:hypothetical protein
MLDISKQASTHALFIPLMVRQLIVISSCVVEYGNVMLRLHTKMTRNFNRLRLEL